MTAVLQHADAVISMARRVISLIAYAILIELQVGAPVFIGQHPEAVALDGVNGLIMD